MTGVLSDEAGAIFILVNHVVLSSVIGVFGIGANVINMCVFLKEGLSNSTNISFFCMAISELCSLVTLLWLNVCLNPYVGRLDDGINFTDVSYLTAGWPHGCAARITSWITVYITFERCLSITLPLRIKQILTPRKTATIVAIIYVVNILSLVPEYSTVYLDWRVAAPKNKKTFGLAFRSNRPVTKGLTFAFHGAFSFSAFLCVVFFTSVLAIQLRRTARWRQQSTSDQVQMKTMSTRDQKTVIMIIMVALSLIVCYSPGVTLSAITICVAGFSVDGKEKNLFWASWSFGFMLHSVNSNVNILLYYKMSSKYRKIFKELFKRRETSDGSSMR
ncbi:unnamed protein product, partial [Lymnaea stagnalis]